MFAEKLNVVMEVLDISNTQLANNIYLDRSYVSKLRRGQRKLPVQPDFVKKICEYFIVVATEKGRLELIGELIGEPYPGEFNKAVVYLENWFTSRLSLNHMVKDLIREISELEENNTVTPGAQGARTQGEETEFIFGMEEKKEGILRAIQCVLDQEKPHKLYWFSQQPMTWKEDHSLFYERLTERMHLFLERGNTAVVVFNKGQYEGEIFRYLSFFLNALCTGKTIPYIYDSEEKNIFLKTTLVVEDLVALVGSSYERNIEDQILLWTKNKRAIQEITKEFQGFLECCEKLLTVETSNYIEKYFDMYRILTTGVGDVYYTDSGFTFYTMPEHLARKIDEENKDLNFFHYYKYAREEFIKLLSENEGHEILELDLTNRVPGEYKFLFGAEFIYYTEEDYKEHLREIVFLLEKYENYKLSLLKASKNKVSLIVRRQGGLIGEKYNHPKLLFFSHVDILVDAFINYYIEVEEKFKYKDRKKLISYLKSFL